MDITEGMVTIPPAMTDASTQALNETQRPREENGT